VANRKQVLLDFAAQYRFDPLVAQNWYNAPLNEIYEVLLFLGFFFLFYFISFFLLFSPSSDKQSKCCWTWPWWQVIGTMHPNEIYEGS
jgi:hypothetical protein